MINTHPKEHTMTLKKLASLIAIATAMTAASAPNALATGQPISLSPEGLTIAAPTPPAPSRSYQAGTHPPPSL